MIVGKQPLAMRCRQNSKARQVSGPSTGVRSFLDASVHFFGLPVGDLPGLGVEGDTVQEDLLPEESEEIFTPSRFAAWG